MQKFKSFKAFWVVSLIIAVVDIIFVFMNYTLSKSSFEANLAKQAEALNLNFNTLLSQTYSNMSAMATYVAGDERVQQLFLQGKKAVEQGDNPKAVAEAQRVRDELYDLVSPNWIEVQNRFSARQLHFHLGPGSTSFLRVHKPNKFGDNMDNVRFTIVDTNEEQRSRVGFETGRVYSGLRGVVPVQAFDQSVQSLVHVGALEVGTSFDVVLGIIDDTSNFGAGVLLTREHIKSAMWPDAIERKFGTQTLTCECVIEASSRPGFEKVIETGRNESVRFRDGGHKILEVEGNHFLVVYQPLRDYQGLKNSSIEAVGAVVFWKDVNEEVASLAASEWYNIIYGLVGFIIVESLLLIALNVGTRRLRRIIDNDSKELRILKDRLNDAQRLASLGNWEWNIQTDEIWWSDEVFHIFGLEPQSITPTYKTFLETVHPEDRADLENAVDASLSNNAAYQVEHRIVLPDGSEKTVKEQAEVIADEFGKPLKMIGTVHDITLDVIAGEALKASVTMYKQMFDLNSAIKLLIDPATGEIISANKAACDFYGYSLDEMSQLSIFDINTLNKEQILHEMETAKKEKRLFFSFKHRIASGEIKDVEVHSGPVNVHGRALLHSIVIDVTDRNRYERALKETTERLEFERRNLSRSQKKYKTLFDSVSVGIVQQNKLGEIIAANDKACEILQLKQEQLLAKTSYDPRWQSIHEDGSEFQGGSHPSIKALQTGEPQLDVVMGLKYPEETIWINIDSIPLFEDNASEPYSVISNFTDITDRLKVEHALKLSENRNELAQNLYGIGVWEWNTVADEVYWSQEMCEIWGVDASEFRGDLDAVQKAIHPDDFASWESDVQQAVEKGINHELEFRIILPNGQTRWIYALGKPMVTEGVTQGMLGICTDVTEKREQLLKLSRAASVFSHAQEGIIITDADGVIVETNQAFHDITGYDEDEVIGQTPRVLKSGRHSEEFYASMWQELIEEGHWEGELWNKSKDDEFFAESLTISSVKDEHGVLTNYVGVFSDITVKKLREETLEKRANYDALTNLPNRRVLNSALEIKLEQPLQHGMAVLFIDLDGFKAINDGYGHSVGDELLIAVSKRFKSLLRSDDIVARVGGDEFILLVDKIRSPEEVKKFASRILEACSTKFSFDIGDVEISSSIGSVFVPEGTIVDATDLINRADAAMYSAKSAGKNQCLNVGWNDL
ncbi:MAG: PAS domain S-box protein [Neptuniibacter sp.]